MIYVYAAYTLVFLFLFGLIGHTFLIAKQTRENRDDS